MFDLKKVLPKTLHVKYFSMIMIKQEDDGEMVVMVVVR